MLLFHTFQKYKLNPHYALKSYLIPSFMKSINVPFEKKFILNVTYKLSFSDIAHFFQFFLYKE